MKKTSIKFSLENAVKLVPVTGQTNVKLETTGRVEVIDCKPRNPYRERKVTLVANDCGEISRSPMGMNHTIRITIPTERFTREEIWVVVDELFDLLTCTL